MHKRGNGLGSTPVRIPRKGRPDTWGVRTPLHFDKAQGKKIRYWIGREYETKTAAEKALKKWITEFEAGEVMPRTDLTVEGLLRKWLGGHRGERTTFHGYEPKARLHVYPRIGPVKIVDVTDELLDEFYRALESEPSATKGGESLGPKSVRHIHNMLSGAFDSVTGPNRLLKVNPARTARPPTGRQVKAAEPDYGMLNDEQTASFLKAIWTPCRNKKCHDYHRCLRDAPLWSSYVATGDRRSEVLGFKWDLINWDEGSIELGWVVVSEGNGYRLRKLTKDGDDNAVIYVDQSFMNVLKYQWERQQYEKRRMGSLWVDHGLVFARDGHMLRDGGVAGGPQDPEKVSARWRRARARHGLPAQFRLHDWRASKITNDLDAHENPVEVSANARHHSPGYTMERYGRRRKEGAVKLAASSADRIRLSDLT